MTPEEAVAHKAQEQFDEYEREIVALRAEVYEQSLDAVINTERLREKVEALTQHWGDIDGAEQYAPFLRRSEVLALFAARSGPRMYNRGEPLDPFVVLSGPASVTHNPKPDWIVTHPRSTSCPWCSEPRAEYPMGTWGWLLDAATPPAEGLDVERLAHDHCVRNVGHALDCPRAALAPEQPE